MSVILASSSHSHLCSAHWQKAYLCKVVDFIISIFFYALCHKEIIKQNTECITSTAEYVIVISMRFRCTFCFYQWPCTAPRRPTFFLRDRHVSSSSQFCWFCIMIERRLPFLFPHYFLFTFSSVLFSKSSL